MKQDGFTNARKHLLRCPVATNKNLKVISSIADGDLTIWICILVTEIQFLFVCVSHVSVLDILPVHQHVVPAQYAHLALTGHHMALKLIAAVSVDLRERNGVDAVLREAGYWL